MMAKKAVLYFAFFSLTLGFGVVGFTIWQDPYCSSCNTIDLNRYSVNSYYQAAQVIKANPDAQVVVVGSSRGQAISPEWLSEKIGKKVINLSVAGASVESKIAFIELAQKLTEINEVFWLADYFEILGDSSDIKLNSMALYKRKDSESLSEFLAKISFGIDHNNFEAAIANRSKVFVPRQGWGNVPEECFKVTFQGKVAPELLDKEVELLYFNYKTGVFAPPESEWKRNLFADFVKKSTDIKINIVLLPYHPKFWSQLKQERPDIVDRQIMWSQSFVSYPVRVFDFLDGFRGDDGSSKYWDDGVHLTCYGSFRIFESIISSGSAIK